MLRRLRAQLTFSNTMAMTAVMIALGGTSYAAFTVPNNSVKSRSIVDGQVKTQDLAKHSVTAKKLAANATKPTGHASGDLVGNYPGPRLRPAVFTDASTVVDNASATCLPQNTGTWVNEEPAEFDRTGYYRDPLGIVHLRGRVENCNSSSPAAFQLPAGFKPARAQAFVASLDGTSTTAVVFIDTGGNVLPEVNLNHAAALSGLTFRCGPAGHNGCP